MKTLTLFVAMSLSLALTSQTPLKSFENQTHPPAQPFRPAVNLSQYGADARLSTGFNFNAMPGLSVSSDHVQAMLITESGSFWIELHPNTMWQSRASLPTVMTELMPAGGSGGQGEVGWEFVASRYDERGHEHVHVQQTYAGIPIARQDMILHIRGGALSDLNGYAWTGPLPDEIPVPMHPEAVIRSAQSYLVTQDVKFNSAPSFDGLALPEDELSLCWIPLEGRLILSYAIAMHPNIMDHWQLYIDATSGEVLHAWSQVCQIHGTRKDYGESTEREQRITQQIGNPNLEIENALMDGPTMIQDIDLLGQNRLVHGYLVGSDFFMIDASRTTMFQPQQSAMPNEPAGVIWTIDGQNGSPQQSNFEVVHVSNTNNNWDPLEVSAHYNAGRSYEYFINTFNWNSLNGNGGNIISIINVADENGDDLDNAFWSGTAMFYGNGDVAFKPLARGLDVAGHEMSHGVIQNTAGLEYVSQSGALNESYADVFGAMIDRDDWKLGEDVVNTTVFPSGALRDLSNPHNGGNGPQDNGWQPQHMNEYQNLPNTPQGDNGGVHVNSGIPNKAFFNFASAVGKDKAEQIWFKALRDYLVKSSQFIDMRNAVERAASDLHGANSPEVTAARSAFDQVGIGAGQGGEYEDDLEVNPGADFILATDASESDLYWVPPSNPSQFVKMNVPAPQSRPSFTDDGTAAVYVDQDNEMILLTFDWSQGLDYNAFYLENNPQGIWRNVVVSKDGTKIAYTTSSLTNEISVFDFISEENAFFELYNPTSASGIVTGDVLYADVMEWDYSGEYLMYDALNRIESSFGDGIEYWDISFVQAWDNASDDFADGYIGKLFTTLPENVSIGNPSFAKNSPYIIVFDFVEEYYDIFGFLQTDYRILAANIEAGYVNEIYENTTIGYPSYSRQDDKVLFTYDDFGDLLLATIDIQAADKTLAVKGSDIVLINGAQKGVWFQTGTRVISDVEETPGRRDLHFYPQPAGDVLFVSSPDEEISFAGYRITDMTGRIVRAGVSDGNRIAMQGLQPGMYLVEVSGEDVVLRDVVVKE